MGHGLFLHQNSMKTDMIHGVQYATIITGEMYGLENPRNAIHKHEWGPKPLENHTFCLASAFF
jgi:hypothetical protein